MRVFFKTIGNIINGITTSVALCCGLVAVVILLPNLAGIQSFVVLSGSMEPKIPAGSVVYINTHAEAEDIEIGDVIAFDIKGNRVVHRVTNIDETYKNFTTKGDANESADLALVSYDDIIGKASWHIPYLGYFIAFVDTKSGLILLATLLILWLVSVKLCEIKSAEYITAHPGDPEYKK